MSKQYKIHRWDSVLFGNRTDPTPIIYVKADKDLHDFVDSNKNILSVEINSTNSIYDKKKVVGLWYKSSEIPNCRTEFFKETELYVFVLQAPWHGYPNKMGEVSVFGVSGGTPVVDIKEELYENSDELKEPFNTNVEHYKNNCKGMPFRGIVGIVFSFLLLVFIIIFTLKK
jgi:hypothetical protein